MRYLICLFTIFVYSSSLSQNQGYWQLPDSAKRAVADFYLINSGVIFIDSILYHHLDSFYISKFNTQTDVKPDPGYFGVRALLVDKEMKNGIFVSRVRSSHADTYIFTFSSNEFKIYDGNYSNKEIISFLEEFLNKNQYLFRDLKLKKVKRRLFKKVKKINI